MLGSRSDIVDVGLVRFYMNTLISWGLVSEKALQGLLLNEGQEVV
jgi:hypothetical protein